MSDNQQRDDLTVPVDAETSFPNSPPSVIDSDFFTFELDFCKTLIQPQLGYNVLSFSRIFSDLRHGPLEGCAQRLVRDSAASLADGRQPFHGPVFRTAPAKLLHQEAVGQHHQVHVPCLVLAGGI